MMLSHRQDRAHDRYAAKAAAARPSPTASYPDWFEETYATTMQSAVKWSGNGRPPALKVAIAELFRDGRERTAEDVTTALRARGFKNATSIRAALVAMRKAGLLKTEYLLGTRIKTQIWAKQ
jgi:hypothetical protein